MAGNAESVKLFTGADSFDIPIGRGEPLSPCTITQDQVLHPMSQLSADLHVPHCAFTPSSQAMDQLKTTVVESGQSIVYADSDSVFIDVELPVTTQAQLNERIRSLFNPNDLKFKYEKIYKMQPMPFRTKRYQSR